MKEGWKHCLLGDALTFQRGFDITKKEQRDGPYKVISSSGPKSTHVDYRAKGPGVVIGRKGTLGSVFYTEEDYWPHDTSLWIKDFHGNDPKFAYYFLQTMGFEKLDVGAANPSLNRNHIHTIPVHYPDLPTQRKIAGILSAYDDLIENNLRRIKILEQMEQSLYREWFVHFRFPGHESTKFVDSELGQIPKGWEVGRLDDILYVQRGFDITKKEQRDGPYQVISSSGPSSFHAEFKVKGPGVVIGRKGALGTVHYTDVDFWPHDTTLWVKEFRRGSALHAFYLLRSLDLERFDSGAAVPTLNRNNIHGLPMVIPPAPLLQRFEEYAKAAHQLLKVLHSQNENLRRTRDALVPQLIS